MPTAFPSSRPRHPAARVFRAAAAAVIALVFMGPFAQRPGQAAEAGRDAAAADAATQKRIDDLQKKIDELTKQLAEARAAGTAVPADRLAEIERRLDVLAAELEKLRTGSGAAEAPLAPGHGL